MKPVCCDTSFLYSLYSQDMHSARAAHLVRTLSRPITLSPLNVYELEHSLRFAFWRKLIPEIQASGCLSSFKGDIATGRLLLMPCDLNDIVLEGQRLCATHTIGGGHRAFDVLHVAAALFLDAGEFLSFDINQRKLAAKEGLKINK